jgi:hypothetical protein
MVIVEPWPQRRSEVKANLARCESEWKSLVAAHLPDANIESFAVYPKGLPTDIRHNAKIFREQLKAWAERR